MLMDSFRRSCLIYLITKCYLISTSEGVHSRLCYGNYPKEQVFPKSCVMFHTVDQECPTAQATDSE
jgi:hypothetical protein